MQSIQQQATDLGTGSLRDAKLRAGSDFLNTLSSLPLRFAGIAGSVSYKPDPMDDIDIFIISENRKLWTTILITLLKRRLHGDSDICLCLFMSEDYALDFFRKQHDPLISEDSVRAVPVIGQEFYRSLLAGSRYLRDSHPEFQYGNSEPENRKGFLSPLEVACFLVGACFLKLKGLIVNRNLRRSGRSSETFRTVVAPGCMILDSLKYNALRKERSEAGP